MPKRHAANGQSGGRGADVWVIVTPDQAQWLARHEGASLSVTSVDGEDVRISNFVPEDKDGGLFEGSESNA